MRIKNDLEICDNYGEWWLDLQESDSEKQIVILLYEENGKYKNDLLDIVTPFQPYMAAQVGNVDATMFQTTITHLSTEGIDREDFEKFADMLADMMKIKVIIEEAPHFEI